MLPIQSNAQTMTSREIAKLTGSRHRDVVRSLCNLIDNEILAADTALREYKVRGKISHEYILSKRDSMVAVAQFSPKFTAAIVDRWQHLESLELEKSSRLESRNNAKLESKFLTDAIKHDKKTDVKHYHFSNEFNLINKTVLGVNAKQYRIANGLEPNQPIRDTLTTGEIAAIEHMQRLDTGMIELGYTYEKRKSELARVFLMRHNKALCAEVKRLES